MAGSLEVVLAGEAVRLLADRALFWPARRRLVIADLHLGKGAAFRAMGIAVPRGGTAHDLVRLRDLLRVTGATALWILGDFLHGGWTPQVAADWRAFRSDHAHIDMAVVPGNHDRAFDAAAAGVTAVAPGSVDPPLLFHHLPTAPDRPDRHVLCGHVHPVVRLPQLGRHPLFWLRAGMCVLPAFSAFTGGHDLALASARGSVACVGGELLRLP